MRAPWCRLGRMAILSVTKVGAAQSAGYLQKLPARSQRICHFQTLKGGKGIFNQFFTIIRPQVLQLMRYFAGQTICIASQNHDAATKEQQREPLTPIAGHLGRLHMRIFRPHPDFPSQKHIHRRYYPYQQYPPPTIVYGGKHCHQCGIAQAGCIKPPASGPIFKQVAFLRLLIAGKIFILPRQLPNQPQDEKQRRHTPPTCP